MSNTLYVIGTGFDKHHGIPSLYTDFINWLKSQSIDALFEQNQIESYCKSGAQLWAEFEKNLGDYNFEMIAENRFGIMPLVLIEYDVKTTKPLAATPYLNNIKDAITRLFATWISTLNTNILPDSDLNFQEGNLFLNFNYTDTLEKVYNIPSRQILHIHGSLAHDEELIFGHNHYVDELSAVIEGNDIRDNEERIQRIYEMNQLIKPVKDIIEANAVFWRSLSDVNRVIVIGTSCHSTEDIDYPYFEKVRNSVAADAEWHVSWHTEQDHSYAKILLRNLNISANKKSFFSDKLFDK